MSTYLISNFRDISFYNLGISPKKIFRSSDLSIYENNELQNFINENNISTIIDLRNNEEVKESHYSDAFKEMINYHHVEIDPRKHIKPLLDVYIPGNENEEIKSVNYFLMYQFYAIECQQQIKDFIDILLQSNGPIVVHCKAGKDRTGVLIALLHLLSGADYNTILTDYMCSSQSVRQKDLDIFLHHVNKFDSAESYLTEYCGVETEKIELLKDFLKN